jgi:hypothetical protein
MSVMGMSHAPQSILLALTSGTVLNCKRSAMPRACTCSMLFVLLVIPLFSGNASPQDLTCSNRSAVQHTMGQHYQSSFCGRNSAKRSS